MRLNPASLADHCPALDLNKRSDEGIVANVTAIQVGRLYDGHIPAELDIDDPNCTALDWIHIAEF
jgi:hypothetical protein